jgi:hypothetical protein
VSDSGTVPSDAESAEPSASELSVAADPNYNPITLKEYFQTWYDGGLTDLQLDEFERGLLGKRVVWEGTVSKVASEWDGRIDVRLKPSDGSSHETAFLEFDPEHRSFLLSLREGQRVRVTCVIEGFVVSPFLKKCSIIRILE